MLEKTRSLKKSVTWKDWAGLDDEEHEASPQAPPGPCPWTSMSEMATEHPWIAELEEKRANADLMMWDCAIPLYCDIEITIKKKKSTISSAKLERLTKQHFGVTKLEECYIFIWEGNFYYAPEPLFSHPPPQAWVNDP